MELTATQRSAIRWIHDGPTEGIHGLTIKALIRRGLVTRENENADPVLTAAGDRAYERIMATGDGPEDLKMLFRF
jgi:hypothetical protein